MNIWIFTPMGIGLVLFFYSLLMAFRTAIQAHRFSIKVVLNLTLTLLSICWISLGVYAYFIIKSQIGS
ncbi:hypothetical protein MBU64_002034 [Enterococcus faecalis]|nr:hypothetical protein [Enterococcus faecalis]EIW2104751.1 hypothetical protein [Enterococcus faecalis]